MVALRKLSARRDNRSSQRRDQRRAKVLRDDLVDTAAELPSERMIRSEQEGQLRAAMARLTDEEAEIVVLKHIEGIRHADIAARLQTRRARRASVSTRR